MPETTVTKEFCLARHDEIERRFASLDVSISKLFVFADRLPAWGTVTIGVLTGLLGASISATVALAIASLT